MFRAKILHGSARLISNLQRNGSRQGIPFQRIGGLDGGRAAVRLIKRPTYLNCARCFSDGGDKRLLRRQDSEMMRMSSIELVPSIADEPEQLTASLSELQAAATKERVPWFKAMMPSVYFRQVHRDRRLRHLVSVAAIPDMEDVPEIVSNEYDNQEYLRSMSIMSSGKEKTGKLERQVMKLPDKGRFLSGTSTLPF